MQLRTFVCGMGLGVGIAWAGSAAMSQGDTGMPDQAEMQKMMEEWQKSMKPGEHHKMLDASVGTWDGTFTMWMGGPGSPEVTASVVAERAWVLDGRFLQETMKGQMPMPDMATGKVTHIPWQGMGLTGYDNYRNMFVGCWADNLGTQLLTFRGMSPDGKTFTFYGEMDEPMMKVVGRTVKYVTEVIDADTQRFSIYDLHAGDDYKVIQIDLKRRK